MIQVRKINNASKLVKIVINMSLLVGTATVTSLSVILMPSSPHSLVLINTIGSPVKKIEITEATTFAKEFENMRDSGLVFRCANSTCKSKTNNSGFEKKEFIMELGIPQKLLVQKDPQTVSVRSLGSLPTDTDIKMFNAGSKELLEQLSLANCASCQNMTNSCKTYLQGKKDCNRFCDYFPSQGKRKHLLSKPGLPKIEKIKSDRCIVKEFLNVSLYENQKLNIPYSKGDDLDIQVSCRAPFPYPPENKTELCGGKFCPFETKVTCKGGFWDIEDQCIACSGTDFCHNLRTKKNSLGSHCKRETGKCICRKDSDCQNESGSANEECSAKMILRNKLQNDCSFGGKCKNPICTTTFNGKTTLIIHKPGVTNVQVHLPHKSCIYASESVWIGAIGGGGPSCERDGCSGGGSGHVVFEKISTSNYTRGENFSLTINVGKSGKNLKNGTPSVIEGPHLWQNITAKGGLAGVLCTTSNCDKRMHSLFRRCDLFKNCTQTSTYKDNQTFARGSVPSIDFGEKLETVFPNSGPLFGAMSGKPGFKENQMRLGRGGGGGGLSVGSDDDRTFKHPGTGFGSGGANGKRGENGIVVLWTEKVIVTSFPQAQLQLQLQLSWKRR